MNVTIMAILLILIVVLTVVTKKVPFNFVLLIIPMVCAMLLGFSVTEVSDFVLEQFASLMKSTGFMLLFAFLYFNELKISMMTSELFALFTPIMMPSLSDISYEANG